jgi:hypothetical protein
MERWSDDAELKGVAPSEDQDPARKEMESGGSVCTRAGISLRDALKSNLQIINKLPDKLLLMDNWKAHVGPAKSKILPEEQS